MTCPYCGTEMEQGYVQSGNGIFWSKEKKKFLIIPGCEDIDLTPNDMWGCANENSYLCWQCHIIIIDIHDRSHLPPFPQK